MAIGDYIPTTYATGDTITAAKLNNNETKTEELDSDYATHKADNAHKYAKSFLLMGA